jgi:hypothetical protein
MRYIRGTVDEAYAGMLLCGSLMLKSDVTEIEDEITLRPVV